jgi:hypothetical protein
MTDYDFGDYNEKLQKVKLDPTRQNLKPVDPSLTFEQYLAIAIKEGEELLAAEEKNSVKKPESFAQPKEKLQDTLGKMSDNPYIRARTQILTKMTPKARSVIEDMEKGSVKKDARYDTFVKQVTILGDKLSSKN